MNVKERRTLDAAIADHVAAEIDLSWIGSQDPEDHAAIKAQAKSCRRRLRDLLNAQMAIAQDARDAV